MSYREQYWKDSFDKSSTEQSEDFAAAQWSRHGLQRRFQVFTRLLEYLHLDSQKIVALDAGCGPGNYTAYLSSIGFDVVAIDFSKSMIKKAQAMVLSLGSTSRGKTTFLTGDVNFLPVDSNLFDLVVCFGVFQHISNAEVVLREFFRVAKSDAYCMINTLNKKFVFSRSQKMLVTYDPQKLQETSEAVGFRCVTSFPMLLFPRHLRFLEELDEIQWLRQYLWPLAHSFTLVLRKPE